MLRPTLRLLRSFSSLTLTIRPLPTLSPLRSPLKHPFSTTNYSSSPLSQILSSQIAYQKQNQPSNTSLLSLISTQGWSISHNQTLIQMTKPLPDKTITLIFFAEPLRLHQQPQQQLQEPQTSFGDYTEFTVYVQKQNDPGKVLYADFLANSQEIRIVNVNFTTDFQTHKMVPKHARPMIEYQGPDVYTLESELRNNLGNYFLELGVNSELVAFVEEYAGNSEHPYYVEWLEDLERFVK